MCKMRIKRCAAFIVVSASLCVSLMITLHITESHSNISKRFNDISSMPFLAPISVYAGSPNVEFTQDHCVQNLESSQKSFQGTPKEVRHIAFLKVHKAASTTLLNVFYRFGQQRDLTFIVPRYEHSFGTHTSMRKRHVFPPPGNKTFDIACLHAIFEKDVYEAYLPNDTVYIATIREPAERFLSAFWYYRRIYELPYLSNIPGPEILGNFLLDPAKHENKDIYYSATNNRMALDFGYPPNQFHNVSHFKQYVDILDSRFDLVMDTNVFPESIILMKRKLNWSLKDVLYLSQNRMQRKPRPLTKDQKAAAEKFLRLDYILYEHFSTRLKSTIRNQDRYFADEVENLKHVQRHVKYFCSRIDYNDMGRKLVVDESRWNKRFEVDFCDCSYMMIEELPAVEMLQRVMQKKLKKNGPNRAFFLSRPK